MGLTATPAFAASPDVTFEDLFEWSQPGTLQDNGSSLQMPYAGLRYKGPGVVTCALAVSCPDKWTGQIDNPQGGTFSIASGSVQGIGFQAHTPDHTPIPPGTHGLTLVFTVNPGTPQVQTVYYTWTYTK